MAAVVDLREVPIEGSGMISMVDRLNDPNDQLTEELVLEVVKRIQEGEFQADAVVEAIRMCGDGRYSNKPLTGGQLFGGTAGLVKSLRIADVMGDGAHASDDVRAYCDSVDIAVGGHRADTHGQVFLSGCGECDAAESAAQLAGYEDSLSVQAVASTITEALGIQAMDKHYLHAIGMIARLQKEGYFTEGYRCIDALEEAHGQTQTIEMLEGDHKEAIWVINTVKGKVFDRAAFAEAYASRDIQVFWEDQWILEVQLKKSGVADEDMTQVLISDLMRRAATALTLTRADLFFIVL